MRRAALMLVLLAVLGATVITRVGASRGAGGPYLVRAIFDNAAFAVSGEDVRIAGANVGSIQSLSVCTTAQQCTPSSPENMAAVTIAINNGEFTPFHANATCAIRPQSLIGERYVDCEPGTSSAPSLTKITGGPGAGSYLLPVTRTSSPIDSDIVQNIYQEPIRERFAVILNELGTGLAARGADLNAVIRRANPALGHTDQVLKILARQNKQLAQLATDSDTVLAPLAKVRRQIAGFVTNANTTSVASAARARDIARSFQLFPEFLRQLRPLMVSLGNLADQGTPLMASLGQSAAALDRQFTNLTPFAKAARPALIALGNSSQKSQPALVGTIPLANRLNKLGHQLAPSASLLDRLTASLNNTGGIEQLMALLFAGVAASNGFNADGHYVRAEPLINGGCVNYAIHPDPTCSANFSGPGSAAAASASTQSKAIAVAERATRDTARSNTSTVLSGLIHYLIGNGK